MYKDWIAKGTKKPGKSRAGLAAHITKALKLDPPMSRTTVYKIIAGTREIHADELQPAAEYMGEPIPHIGQLIASAGHVAVIIRGNVRAGVWVDKENSETSLGSIIIPKDHDYPELTHLAFIASDDSMNGIRVFEGDTIICIDFKETKLKLATGMVVVIERKNSVGLIERTLRAVDVKGTKTEYKSVCNDKEYKSVICDKAKTNGEKISVVGILRRSIRDYR